MSHRKTSIWCQNLQFHPPQPGERSHTVRVGLDVIEQGEERASSQRIDKKQTKLRSSPRRGEMASQGHRGQCSPSRDNPGFWAFSLKPTKTVVNASEIRTKNTGKTAREKRHKIGMHTARRRSLLEGGEGHKKGGTRLLTPRDAPACNSWNDL